MKEIAPMVRLKEVPNAPDFFAGFFNYRGTIVPVIDLGQLIQGQPCQMRLSTRIILVDYIRDDGTPGVLGLLAERVTEAIKKSSQDFVFPGVAMQEAPYLGGIVMEQEKMIHYIDVDLLPQNLSFLPMPPKTIAKHVPDHH